MRTTEIGRHPTHHLHAHHSSEFVQNLTFESEKFIESLILLVEQILRDLSSSSFDYQIERNKQLVQRNPG